MLDILTPKGQKTLEEVNRACALFTKHNPFYSFIFTNPDEPGAMDAFVVKGEGVKCFTEIKCRNMRLEDLRSKFQNRWLLSYEKVHKGVNISKSLCCPFYGLLYLIPDKTLLTIQICNQKGHITAKMSLDYTFSQRSINGEEAIRTNAYIQMDQAKIYL